MRLLVSPRLTLQARARLAALIFVVPLACASSQSEYQTGDCGAFARQFGNHLERVISDLNLDPSVTSQEAPFRVEEATVLVEAWTNEINILSRSLAEHRRGSCPPDSFYEDAEKRLSEETREVLYRYTQSQVDGARMMENYEEWESHFRNVLARALTSVRPSPE